MNEEANPKMILTWSEDSIFFGIIGEKTNLIDSHGEPLAIGDVVSIYEIVEGEVVFRIDTFVVRGCWDSANVIFGVGNGDWDKKLMIENGKISQSASGKAIMCKVNEMYNLSKSPIYICAIKKKGYKYVEYGEKHYGCTAMDLNDLNMKARPYNVVYNYGFDEVEFRSKENLISWLRESRGNVEIGIRNKLWSAVLDKQKMVRRIL